VGEGVEGLNGGSAGGRRCGGDDKGHASRWERLSIIRSDDDRSSQELFSSPCAFTASPVDVNRMLGLHEEGTRQPKEALKFHKRLGAVKPSYKYYVVSGVNLRRSPSVRSAGAIPCGS
jgi:hypothetical protein